MRFEDFRQTVRMFQKGIDNRELTAYEDADECEVIFRTEDGTEHRITDGIRLEVSADGKKAVIQ